MGIGFKFFVCSVSCDCYRHDKQQSSNGDRFGTLVQRGWVNDPADQLPQPVYVTEVLPPANPDPNNFEIFNVVGVGPHTVARIRYPDATNYEGEKVLVYLHVTIAELMEAKVLDPHFCEGSHIKPFARFEPTSKGWHAAIETAMSQ